jgi:Fic family protein
MQVWKLDELPLKDTDLETKAVLKALPSARAALAELKVVASTIPNQAILIHSLGLQEAKDSSAIENILTTHDELFKSGLFSEAYPSHHAKEVQHYREGLQCGFDFVKEHGYLSIKALLDIQEIIVRNKAGFRKLPGTTIRNSANNEVIYTPPQDPQVVLQLMNNLEDYINNASLDDCDPLIKMAVIHFQFESIHPFYDGNGRTGRIINLLYLILHQLQDLPILYLSGYINKNKAEYYRLLQGVREHGAWEEWLLFVIQGVESTARETIDLIHQIKSLMLVYKYRLRAKYKFYSQELLHHLFEYPYTKIDYVVAQLGVSRLTAAKYLNQLAEDGFLVKLKFGTAHYYVHQALMNLLSNSPMPRA